MSCDQNDVMRADKLTGGLHVNSAASSFTFWVIYAVRPSYFLRKRIMSSSGPTLAQIEVVAIVLTVVAVIVTIFRLCIRAQQKRLWIDDAWAALSMIFNFMLLIVDCLYAQDYERYPQGARVAIYYICMVIEVIHIVYHCATHSPENLF
ncbi:uncharacterized protein BJ212DRAFT_632794 [Suillus subaureus]|uniref:Uncharacterized protein n=1 Tax=Suillus subaureus TaxID=48587 RepID=A0A9P7E1M7_9AGAM|nr:uncharacterized protein BJ212DRAFT_632794 [Suillus subaureus]KAG1808981.1 hypothetical protein BJ212DRAFT_632794 [Suillus subaureus]